MREIDKYIDTIYKNFDGSTEEIKELKEEMRSHLLENITILESSGKSRAEAIKLTLADFGQETDLSTDLSEIFPPNKVILNPLLSFAVACLIIGLIALGALYLNSFKQNNRFHAFLDDVRTEIATAENRDESYAANVFKNRIDDKINDFHNETGWNTTTLTHFSILLVPVPRDKEKVYEGIADYRWGERINDDQITSYYHGSDEFGIIKLQSKTNKLGFYIPFIFFTSFILFTIIYYSVNRIANRQLIRLRGLLYKGMIAAISSILLSLGYTLFIYFMQGMTGFDLSFPIIIIVLSFPLYLIVGIPVSYLIDAWSLKFVIKNRFLNYLINLALYILFGIIAGYLLILTFGYSRDISHDFFLDEMSIYVLLSAVAAIIGYHVLLLFNAILHKNKIEKS